MKKEYYAIFEKSPTDSSFSAYCPDYPGVMADGENLQEAQKNIIEAIEFYLEDAEYTEPSTLEKITDFEFETSNKVVILPIEVVVEQLTCRFNVSTNYKFRDCIDDYVESHKEGSRSNFLMRAADEYMRNHP